MRAFRAMCRSGLYRGAIRPPSRMIAPQWRTALRRVHARIRLGARGESATGAQTLLCGSPGLERLVVGTSTRTDAAVARRILRRLPSIGIATYLVAIG
jgi:hypothetical protein